MYIELEDMSLNMTMNSMGFCCCCCCSQFRREQGAHFKKEEKKQRNNVRDVYR